MAAAEQGTSNVIYAIEEPETSQHPNNQRMLMRAFAELADQPGCQVILTTHTPVLGRLVPMESLRYICEDRGRKIHAGTDETYKLVAKALGVLPDHNVKLFIGVEGQNDIKFLHNIARVLRSAGEDVLDLEQLETEGQIMFIPLGGSTLEQWISRLEGLRRPEFYIFDRDNEPSRPAKYQNAADKFNSRKGCKAVITKKGEMENYLHPDAIRAAAFSTGRGEVCLTFGDFDDVPELVAQYIHEHNDTAKAWSEIKPEDRKKKGSSHKSWLNTDAASLMTPELLSAIDPADEVRGWLADIKAIFESGSVM